MSNISIIHDRILTVLATQYSSRLRMVNPYDPQDNPNHILKSGYGLRVGQQNPIDQEFHNKAVEQTFTVVLTNEIYTIENQTSPTDTAIKAMLEDINSGQKLFYNINQIEIADNVDDIDLGSVSPVSYLNSETRFLLMEYDLIFTITETL